MNHFQFFLGCFFILVFCTCKDQKALEDQLKESALKRLHHNLLYQKNWVKVHAAEHLIDLGYNALVDSIFQMEVANFEAQSPNRIGIWRVLSRTNQRENWVAKIIEVAQDSAANDQIYAIESLVTLQIQADWFSDTLQQQIFNSNHDRLKYYAQWASAIKDKAQRFKILQKMLSAKDVEARQIGALAIFNLDDYPEKDWNSLADLALSEDSGSKAKVFLIAAALCTHKKAPKSEKYQILETVLLSHENNYSKNDRYFLCETLAKTGQPKHLQSLNNLMLMNHPILTIETLESPQEHPWNIDVAGAAAFGILKILGE